MTFDEKFNTINLSKINKLGKRIKRKKILYNIILCLTKF
jgi:hypothetical protein